MADTTEEGSDAQITFKVKTSGEGNHVITMAESATVEDLKKKLSGEDMENIPVERQRLIYSGRVMKNEDALSTYKIKPNNTIHLVKSAASNRTPAATAGSTSGGPAQPAVPANMAAGTSANNILAGLTGARFAGHAPLPSADIFGPDGGMNPPSEEQLAEMLQNPALAQSMNEALNNPQFVDFMIESNPMLRAMPNAREVLQSPEFRHMMTDTESLRMAARMRAMLGPRGGGPGAFPAPGATDNTPAGAPASESGGDRQGQQGPPAFDPFAFNPGMFGLPPSGPGNNQPAANPFAALFGGGPQQRSQQQRAQGGGATAPSATANPSSPSATPAAGANNQQAGASPWASLFQNPPPGGAAGNPFGMTPEMMQGLMQMMGSGGGPFGAQAPPPPDDRPAEDRYAEQLRQLNDMGFFDFDRNVAALRRSGGSVQGAIEYLLNG